MSIYIIINEEIRGGFKCARILSQWHHNSFVYLFLELHSHTHIYTYVHIHNMNMHVRIHTHILLHELHFAGPRL